MSNGLSDREVAEVAQKVTVVHDDEAEAIYPSTRLGKVSLETQQGQQYSAKVFYPKGSPENPLSGDELREKFLGLAAMVLSRGRAQQLFDAIQNIEQLRDTGELAQLLTTNS
jgi:2-methylcitrate dehydratase PrpD